MISWAMWTTFFLFTSSSCWNRTNTSCYRQYTLTTNFAKPGNSQAHWKSPSSPVHSKKKMAGLSSQPAEQTLQPFPSPSPGLSGVCRLTVTGRSHNGLIWPTALAPLLDWKVLLAPVEPICISGIKHRCWQYHERVTQDERRGQWESYSWTPPTPASESCERQQTRSAANMPPAEINVRSTFNVGIKMNFLQR